MPERQFEGQASNGEKIFSVHYDRGEKQARREASLDKRLFTDISLQSARPGNYRDIWELFSGMRGYADTHFGASIKESNFSQICDRITARAEKGLPPVTEQVVAIHQQRVVGFIRFQHQENGITHLSHLFARSVDVKAPSPVANDPKPVYASVAGILEREACERATKLGSRQMLVVADGGDPYRAYVWNESFPAYSTARGAQPGTLLPSKNLVL